MTGAYLLARVTERERTARREYKRSREFWVHVGRRLINAEKRARAFREAVDARTYWNAHASLLREPIAADELAEAV
jgi:hypothetical protein